MSEYKPGQTVRLKDGRRGVVRFVGETDFQVGEWIGIELPDKTGKNDGSVHDVRYFDCPAAHGMFVRPVMVDAIISQPQPAAKPAAAARKLGSRATSFNPSSGRSSAAADSATAKRRSLNAPSPSPVPKPSSRPSSVSPTKSPTKQLSGPPSAATSRTNTPSNPRVPSIMAKARPSIGTQRTPMGPPAAPASRTARQSSTSAPTRAGGAPTRTAGVRLSSGGPRVLTRADAGRRPSVDSQAGPGSRTADRSDDGAPGSPPKGDWEILSPQPHSPVAAKANDLEKMANASSTTPTAPPPTATTTTTIGAAAATATRAATAASAATNRKSASVTASSRQPGTAAATREIEDLKAKLKVLERKRLDDRDRLRQLDRIQGERDKFEAIIAKLQQKYAPQQQENIELRKQLKEAEAKFEAIEAMQAEHDSALELATLDREMAEETTEVLKAEADALKQKVEELELETEILREENEEYSKGMTPEERSSAGWLQMERTNERLREALIRLRDLTQAQEEELRAQVASLEEDLKDIGSIKEEQVATLEKLEQSETAVEDLRQQLDHALGAEEMIEDLTERNMSMTEQIDELKAVIDDLENLKEVNDELEANHVQNEKEMQEEMDFKDSVIAEQARRAGQQEELLEDMEYTLSRFRELVTNLQGDLDDMRASQAVTEGESEKLNDHSRAMMDLNMKLQISAAKTQVKTIDLEMRRLEAQEAEQHLGIVQLFLPDSYKEDRESVLALLRFRRLSFKATLLSGFLKERVNGKPHPGHENDVFAGCDAIDKLVWVSAMCDRFVNDISHCTVEQFSHYQNALLELEPVERALNAWIDELRRDELREKDCAAQLQRTIALMSHLAGVHISEGLPGFADEAHMRSLAVQSYLDSATVIFTVLRGMVQRVVSAAGSGEEGSDDELAQHFAKKSDLVITQTRSAKVTAGKAVRALEELKTRSLSLLPDTQEAFERCEGSSRELAELARQIGNGIHALLTLDEGRTEPFTYAELRDAASKAAPEATSSNEADLFSAYLAKLRNVHGQIADLAALATDLNQTQEFDVSPEPWKLRSQELKALKTMPLDAEEELRRLKEQHAEARRTIAQRDEYLSTAHLKIETLESRMRDAQANVERITALQWELDRSGRQVSSLKEDIERQDRELKSLEADRDKWKTVASESRMQAGSGDGAGSRAGKERAVATAREMESLKQDIESLQAAVRYLREDNRRARTREQHNYDWLAEPLGQRPGPAEQCKALVVAEGKDALGELLRMASTASVFDFRALPEDKLAWRPAKATPQYHAARQMEDYAAWRAWRDAVAKKSDLLRLGRRTGPSIKDPAARLQVRLPGTDGKAMTGSSTREVQIVGSQEWEALLGTREGDENQQ